MNVRMVSTFLVLLATLVAARPGAARASTPPISGPVQWSASSYPNNLTLGPAEDMYCYMTGFSVGWCYKDASTDKVYVYIGSDRNWHLGGSNSNGGKPSSSVWAQATCVWYLNGTAMFSPWLGIQTLGACPPQTDPQTGGECFGWNSSSGLFNQSVSSLWTPP